MFCASTRGGMIPNRWFALTESRQVKDKRGLGVRAGGGQEAPPEAASGKAARTRSKYLSY